MFISADFINSRIRESDADKLMPSFDLPVYRDYGIVKFDTLQYSGNPLKFEIYCCIQNAAG